MREERGVVLSTSKPILRDRSAMWIKETLLDPAICSQHCCRVGFEQAEVLCALRYDNITSHIPDIDAFVPAPEADLVPCADCLEPSPPAQCVVCRKHLCSDCLANHTSNAIKTCVPHQFESVVTFSCSEQHPYGWP